MEENYVDKRSGGTLFFFFSSRRRHTGCSRDWSSDVCSSDLRTHVSRLAASAACTEATVASTGLNSLAGAEGWLMSGKAAAENAIATSNSGLLLTVAAPPASRSEERRVGKEGQCRGSGMR